MLLPALAGAKLKAKKIQCINNMHQVYIASTIYAGDAADWYPIWVDGSGHPKNELHGEHYTRYVVGPTSSSGPASTHVPEATGNGWEFQNLGYAYASGLISDGKVLFCPSFPQSSQLSSYQYSSPTFMSTGTDGQTRSTIMFNPRVVNASGYVSGSSNPNSLRAYQKTSTAKGHKLFAMDYLESGSAGGVDFSPNGFAHYPSKGWNILFTDGACRYVYSPAAYALASSVSFVTGETQQSCVQYDTIFNDLENSER